jgi:hypothetical protein
MDPYLTRARATLDAFDDARRAFAAGLTATRATMPAKTAITLDELVPRLESATTRLRHSCDQIEVTGIDVVDLQVRLEGEGAALAAPLKALGELLPKIPDVAVALADELVNLEEAAERVAAAIFPNAIEGVAEVNRTLWDVRPLWNEYSRVLAREVTRTGDGRLTATQIANVERSAGEVRARFDAVNDLLNQLVATPLADDAAVRALLKNTRVTLLEAVKFAKSKAADAYKPFHGVLGKAEALARRVDTQLARVRVPVFPGDTALAAFADAVPAALYRDAAGVERFALFNIAARLQSIATASSAGEHLLSPCFAIRVFALFPDRVYFSADRSFIEAIAALEGRVFEKAPASLHRFKDGSYKQTQFRKGNLQVSFAAGAPDAPGDRNRVSVDADIDLYRSAVRHLFGEVLINHLTGSKTDQFRVWDTLSAASVLPVAGFGVVSADRA